MYYVFSFIHLFTFFQDVDIVWYSDPYELFFSEEMMVTELYCSIVVSSLKQFMNAFIRAPVYIKFILNYYFRYMTLFGWTTEGLWKVCSLKLQLLLYNLTLLQSSNRICTICCQCRLLFFTLQLQGVRCVSKYLLSILCRPYISSAELPGIWMLLKTGMIRYYLFYTSLYLLILRSLLSLASLGRLLLVLVFILFFLNIFFLILQLFVTTVNT